jgi:hypothetical protein
MTWAFWDKYAEEAYGIVDNKDVWVDPATNPLNIEKLNGYLNEITQNNEQNKKSPICNFVRKLLKRK